MKTISAYKHGATESVSKDFMDPARDRPRGKQMLKMRIVVREGITALIVPGHTGRTVNAGEHIIPVYEDEVRAFKALVEPTPELVSQAMRAYEIAIAADVVRLMQSNRSAEEMADIIAGRFCDLDDNGNQIGEPYAPDEKILAAVDKAREVAAYSLQSRFYDANARTIRPLVSAEVVDGERFAEPQQKLKDEEQKRSAELILTAVKGAMPGAAAAAPGDQDEIAQLKRLVADQAAALELQGEQLQDLNRRLEEQSKIDNSSGKPKR
jgi:hypothetical protein